MKAEVVRRVLAKNKTEEDNEDLSEVSSNDDNDFNYASNIHKISDKDFSIASDISERSYFNVVEEAEIE